MDYEEIHFRHFQKPASFQDAIILVDIFLL